MSILQFRGKHAFLSNFYACQVHYDGQTYPTLEHAYQAAKCDESKDRELIRRTEGPANAKRLGRQLAQYGRTRRDWEAVKVDVMRELLRSKFINSPMLTRKLLATGHHDLIEVNTWNDREWGVCGGEGQNLLGKLLMEVRAELRKEYANPPDHDLYKTGDPDVPKALTDRNGEVALSQCRRCGRAEVELDELCVERA